MHNVKPYVYSRPWVNVFLTKKDQTKVVLTCEKDKDAIMANLTYLKGNEDFSKISDTEDYTIGDRNLIKGSTERAKAKNTQETAESNYEWKVRGTPKNGLLLKKFQKRIPTQQL